MLLEIFNLVSWMQTELSSRNSCHLSGWRPLHLHSVFKIESVTLGKVNNSSNCSLMQSCITKSVPVAPTNQYNLHNNVCMTTLKCEGLCVFSVCGKEHIDSVQISHLPFLHRRVSQGELEHGSLGSDITRSWAVITGYSLLVREITFKVRT